jgi:hypothetical protein
VKNVKKVLLTAVVAVSLLGSGTGPVFADTIFNGGSEQPAAVVSNPASTAGQAQSSSTDTGNKFTTDGYRWVFD